MQRKPSSGVTRRQFLSVVGAGGVRLGAGLTAGPLLLDLAGCGDAKSGGPPIGADEVLLGLYRRSDVASGEQAVRQALARMDLSWLKRGDKVLVKLASNSANPHPAVTSPEAVRGLCRVLRERGAGSVIVADQAGAEHVRLAPGEQRYGSTRAVTQMNGLLAAVTDAGAEPHFFDDQGFDAGYFAATPPAGSHWTQPLMIPNVVKQVDHIVYLPRLAIHVLCGYSIGHKIAMGFLRDDSRHHVHHEAGSIYEKYTEINYVPEIRDRFRLALTLAEALMLDNGPDEGTVATADPRIVVASRNLAHHDAVATGLLVHFDATLPSTIGNPYDPASASINNQNFVLYGVNILTGIPWGPANAGEYEPYSAHAFEQGIDSDRALGRAFEIRGGVPSTIGIVATGAPLGSDVRAALDHHGGGRFRFL